MIEFKIIITEKDDQVDIQTKGQACICSGAEMAVFQEIEKFLNDKFQHVRGLPKATRIGQG